MTKNQGFASSSAAFYPLGADLFLSSRKIDHIARFIQIPSINIPGDAPSILIVNIQVAAYFLFEIELELITRQQMNYGIIKNRPVLDC